MRKKSLTMLALLFVAAPAMAVDVRGRVDFLGPSGPFPMARAEVRLCNVQYGQCTTNYITGGDGMYYFQSLSPGPHAVIVNGRERWQVLLPAAQAFDIAPTQGN